MSHYVYETETDKFNKFLRQLIDAGRLKATARGITLRVIAKGLHTLSRSQKFVFQTEVVEKFVRKTCRCGNEISWDEMFFVEDGKCIDCQNKLPIAVSLARSRRY
jgi:hypothetical protein